MADSPLTLIRSQGTQYVKPEALIKAAKTLKPFFTNKDGSFATERFARLIGTIRRDKNKVQGFFPQVSYKSGHWKIEYKKERDQSRSEAEAIPAQMEWVMKNWPKYGNEDLWKRFKKFVTESRGQAFAQSKLESTPEDPVEGGHLARMRGYGVKDTTPQGIPNVGPNIIPERKYGYPVFDNQGNFVRMAPGNEPKKNDPREHFKRSDIEIAGGGMSANWMDVGAQFMMQEIYGDNITGTNVENLTRGDKETARDQKVNIQVMAQRRDRLNQLAQQTKELVAASAGESYKLQRQPGINMQTGLRGQQSLVGRTYELERQWMEKHGPGAGWNRMSTAIEGAVTGTAQVLLNAGTEAVKSGVAKASPIARGAIAAGEVSTGDYIGAASTLLGFEDVTYEKIPKNQLEAVGREFKRDIKVPSSLPPPRTLPSRVGRY